MKTRFFVRHFAYIRSTLTTVGWMGLGLALLLSACTQTNSENLSSQELSPSTRVKIVYPFSVKKNSTLSQELRALGYSSLEIHNIVQASKSTYDLAQIYPGLKYRQIENTQDLEFQLSSVKSLKLVRSPEGQWSASLNEKQVTTQVTRFSGVVTNSLWESAQRAQMDKTLIADMTEVFAWQVDFSREVRENDTWRIVVEQEFVDDEPVGWGKILAAEYVNGSKKLEAIYFEKPNKIRGYFSPDGKSLEKLFLRSPIEFARITSGFSLRRFHPVLKVTRPHLGVDYAAAPGTPIRSIGDGRIVESRYTSGGGNTLVISHNSIYSSRYLHLKGFARGLRIGSSVKQGQIIGYVGSTGLATGPHLHFEFYRYGVYKDPLKVELPSAQSVPSSLLGEFSVHAQNVLAQLPQPAQSVAMSDQKPVPQ